MDILINNAGYSIIGNFAESALSQAMQASARCSSSAG
jgi:short-subunit dehydrogenase